MILSDFTIEYLCSLRQRGLISPFNVRTKYEGMTYGLGPASYDVRIAQTIVLPPKKFVLASTIEYFVMPNYIAAEVKDKSTWARRGLSLFNTFIDPGWEGYLTLELVNNSEDVLTIKQGMPIAQIVFSSLDAPVRNPYRGKYFEQANKPVAPIEEQ